jgi:thioredoxin-related protein
MKIPFLFLTVAFLAAPLRAGDPAWSNDYVAARAAAAKTGRRLLLDFTGSDWCVFCQKLDREVFSTPEFRDFARNFILVRLDYPSRKKLSPAEETQNGELRQRYKIDGFPTLIVTDASGTELCRATGYSPGSGPQAFLAPFAPSP